MENNKKIKIVIAINDFCIGGAQTLLLKQFQYFDKNKFDFYLISLFELKRKTSLHDLIPEYVKVVRFDFKSFWDFSSWRKLLKKLKKIKPSLILSHLFFSNTVLRILAIFLKIKIIIVEHNTYINKTKLHQYIDKFLSYFTYKIIAVSDEVADFTSKQEKISKSKFVTIFNGIDLEEIKKFKEVNKKNVLQFRKELGFSMDDRVIINVARLTHQKRLDLLIDVFAELNRIDDQYRMIILGEGSLKEKLIQKVENLGLENKIFLLGSKKDINKYYMLSNVFISTSEIEGFSIAFLEALSFGLPIISTKTSGSEKMIKNNYNGYLVDNEEKNIASSIINILKNNYNKINSMGSNSLEICKEFDIRANVEKYEKLFKECLKI